MINKVLLMEFFKDDDIKVVDKDFYIKSQMKNDVIKYITILEEENERLNNIINEYVKPLIVLQNRINNGMSEEEQNKYAIRYVKLKLGELKGSDEE